MICDVKARHGVGNWKGNVYGKGEHTLSHVGPGFSMVPVLGSLQAEAGALFWKQRDHVLRNEF